ncbi:hypothetical protein TNCV_1660011 [Trichonephila clavipes]|nr:hypothetical protein TNCV_1660011 [Trichonephila clavipes]
MSLAVAIIRSRSKGLEAESNTSYAVAATRLVETSDLLSSINPGRFLTVSQIWKSTRKVLGSPGFRASQSRNLYISWPFASLRSRRQHWTTQLHFTSTTQTTLAPAI